jgi:hypothetical protein
MLFGLWVILFGIALLFWFLLRFSDEYQDKLVYGLLSFGLFFSVALLTFQLSDLVSWEQEATAYIAMLFAFLGFVEVMAHSVSMFNIGRKTHRDNGR